jgi:hypothetical protein
MNKIRQKAGVKDREQPRPYIKQGVDLLQEQATSNPDTLGQVIVI